MVDKGYQECGAVIVGLNDSNVNFCEWVHNNGQKSVLGDIRHSSTIQKLATLQRGILSAGVSCQPWSNLGDLKGQHDERSASLPATLKAGFLLQTPAIVLECTPNAKESEWVQKQLQDFADSTGYVLKQTTLPLHTIWPAKRNRWWATLTHRMFHVGDIPELPKLAFQPNMNHLFQNMASLTPEQESELALDRYELRNFYGTPEGIGKQMVNFTKPLPTATHSWGSQLRGCPCGCRASGFNPERLEKRGLYGQLVPISGQEDFEGFKAEKMRHLHPAEVALANGADPTSYGKIEGSLRLELAGVGQCASPIQSLWVYANMLKDIQSSMGITPTIDPLQVLKNYGKKLFAFRDQFFQIGSIKNKYLQLFDHVWEHLGEENYQPRIHEDPEVHDKFDDQSRVKESSDEPKVENLSTIQSSQEAFDQAFLKAFPVVPSPGKRKAWEVGVPGFETSKGAKTHRTRVEHFVEGATTAPNNECGGSSLMAVDPKNETQAPVVEKSNVASDESIVRFVCEGHSPPYPVKCSKQSTIKQLSEAILHLGESIGSKVVDIFGNIVPCDSIIQHEQVIRFVGVNGDWDGMIPCAHLPDNRKDMLWHQDARVEMSEMNYYLSALGGEFPNQTLDGISVSDEPDDLIRFGNHIVQLVDMMHRNEQKAIATCVLYQQHWIPLFFDKNEGIFQITTVPSFASYTQHICSLMGAGSTVQIIGQSMEGVAQFDCGFQTIAWLQSKLLQVEEMIPFQPLQASRWRMVYFLSQEIMQNLDTPMMFGGHESLQQLLIQHGVSERRAGECASQLTEALGSSTIEQIMRSPKPWADLKSRANLVRPPIKIVQSDELHEMIRKRAQSGKPVGSKANKQKKQVETPLVLKAVQLEIPHAVFKQEDGVELSQLHAEQVQSKSMGIILMNIEEALPFLSLKHPVSSEGVGLLILDHSDPRLPGCHEIVRVPTTCTATGEPLLITAALLQLGENVSKETSRHIALPFRKSKMLY